MNDILIWLISLLIGIILTLLLQNPIQILITTVLGGWIPRSERGVKGFWHSTYTYQSKEEVRTQNHLVEFKQFGNYVVGKSLAGGTHVFKLRGKIYFQTYFTGIWESSIEGDITHGSYQYVIDNKGRLMEGKWLGTNRKHGINEGDWHWELITKKTSSKTKKELIEKFQSTKLQPV